MTGGGGFLGSHLVDYLMTRGDHVRAGPTAGRHAQCTPRYCLAAATVGGTYSRVLSLRRGQLLCHLVRTRAVRSAAECAAECLTLNWLWCPALQVICMDNFFTGSHANVAHHLGKPNFELIRHDIVEPILLEARQPPSRPPTL